MLPNCEPGSLASQKHLMITTISVEAEAWHNRDRRIGNLVLSFTYAAWTYLVSIFNVSISLYNEFLL